MSKNQPPSNKTEVIQPTEEFRSPFPGAGGQYPPRPNGPMHGGVPYGRPINPLGRDPSSFQGGHFPVPSQQPASQGTGSFLDKLPIKDIKGFVDRMGGIDGIMNMVNKMNSMVKTFQQMTPMVKLLLGSFASKAVTTENKGGQYRRKRRSSSGRRRPASRGNRNSGRYNTSKHRSGNRATSKKRTTASKKSSPRRRPR